MNPGLDFCLLFINGKGGRGKGATEASQQSKLIHGPQTLEIDDHLLSNCIKKRWSPEKLPNPKYPAAHVVYLSEGLPQIGKVANNPIKTTDHP